MNLSPLVLKKDEDRRIRAGHLWVFSNEVDTSKTPLSDFEAGQLIELLDRQGRSLGTGYVNPQSLICARLISRNSRQVLDLSLLMRRIDAAIKLREQFFDAPFYRLIFGESDGLPGLVVDRFDGTLVVQITTAGMEKVKADIIAALNDALKPSCIVFRNDNAIRQHEGLELYTETPLGVCPEKVLVSENGTVFEINPLSGQKTGWFYDHRQNRLQMLRYIKDQRVLDVFSYCGSWGIQAAKGGAKEVLCLDSSATALTQLQHNAELNGVNDKTSTLLGDAFETLKTLHTEKQKFDVVILDPPAFIKRKKDLKNGLQAYRQINQLAMRLISPGGILISASCSYHLSSHQLMNAMLQASRHHSRQLQILEHGHQSMDHPIHPAIPESNYLKAFFSHLA